MGCNIHHKTFEIKLYLCNERSRYWKILFYLMMLLQSSNLFFFLFYKFVISHIDLHINSNINNKLIFKCYTASREIVSRKHFYCIVIYQIYTSFIHICFFGPNSFRVYGFLVPHLVSSLRRKRHADTWTCSKLLNVLGGTSESWRNRFLELLCWK